jgi:carboxymethylenebutenolidase
VAPVLEAPRTVTLKALELAGGERMKPIRLLTMAVLGAGAAAGCGGGNADPGQPAAVAHQLAADGFIAIAPDLLTGEGVPRGAEGPVPDSAVAAVRALDPDAVQRRIGAVAAYGMALPAALPVYGIMGFCWGGGVAFAHAAAAPGLDASVVYYGTSPDPERLASVRAPVLGLYGEDDARVNATIPPADPVMSGLGLTHEHEIYPGAGRGFLRARDGREGANMAATRQAWPRTIEWLRSHLEG